MFMKRLRKLDKKLQKKKKFEKKFPGVSKKLNINVEYLKYIEEGKVDKIPDHIPNKRICENICKTLKC